MNTSQSDSLLFLPNGYIDSPTSLLDLKPETRNPADGFPFGWDGQSPASANSITSSVSLSSLDEFRFGSQSSSSSSLMDHRSTVSTSSDGDSEGTSSSSFCSGNGPAFSFTAPGQPPLNRSYSSSSATTKHDPSLSRSLSSRPPSKPLLHLPTTHGDGSVPPSLGARRGSLPASGPVPFHHTASSGPSALASRRGSNGPPPAPSAWSWNARGSELQGIPSPLRMEYTTNDLGLFDHEADDDVSMDDPAEVSGRRFEGSPRRVNASPSPLSGMRSLGNGYNGSPVRGKPQSPYGRGGSASRKMSLPTHFASQTTTTYSSSSTTTTTTTTSSSNNFFLSQPGMSGTPQGGRANFSLAVPPAGTKTPLSPESPTTHLQPIPPHRSQQQQYYQQQQQQQQIKQPSFPPTSLLHQTKPGAAGYPFPPQGKPQTPPATPRTVLSGLPAQQSSASSSSSKGSKASASTTPAAAAAPSGPSTLSVSLLDGHDLNALFESRYTLISSLGSGGYGFVCVATDHASGKEVAVKFILASKVPAHAWVAYAGGGEEGDGMPEVGGKVPMECEVLRRVRHWGVVAGLGVYYDSKFFYLVSPLCLPKDIDMSQSLIHFFPFSCLQVQELHGDPWAPSTPGTPSASAQSSPSVTMPPLPTIGMGPPSPFAPSFALPASPFVGPTQSLPPPSPVTPIRPSINMERRGSCDLFECVERHKKFGEARARMIFKQIGQSSQSFESVRSETDPDASCFVLATVETVFYLSRVGIYHRDIKDENLVIDRDYKVKLIDFGSAVWERDPENPGKYKELSVIIFILHAPLHLVPPLY